MGEAKGSTPDVMQSQPKDNSAKTKSPQQAVGYAEHKRVGTGKRYAPR